MLSIIITMITAAESSDIQKEEMEDVPACVTSAVVSSTANSSKKKRKRKVEWSAVGVADTTTTRRRLRCLDCGYCSCKCASGLPKVRHRLQCLDCRYSACRCAVTTQTIAETKKIREACLDCRYIACQCAVTTQTKAETKKIWEAATAAATQKKAETKKIREAATQKKAETKKIREAATDNRVSALTAKKMNEAADQKPPQGQEKWVDELGNPSPIYEYTTEEVGLINMKFSLFNKGEKENYDATKVFAMDNPVDLSLTNKQKSDTAWVKDKIVVSKLQKQELQQSPQYINIPDDGLHPSINMTKSLRHGVKLLKLKSVNDKELMVLLCQAIDLLFTVRITHKSFWNAMQSDCGNLSRQQAEGFYTWKGRFNNKFFCTVFLKILKSLNLTETDIDNLIKVLSPSMRSIAHLCQLAYKFMGLLDLWICERNDPHCAFGKIGNKGSILDTDYDTFQNNCLLRLKGITVDDNNTRELLQGAVNQVLVGGNFITTGFEQRSVSFGPMLVTGSSNKKGAIHLRDVVLEANGYATVCESCTLKDKLIDELSRLEYSGDADQHVRNFIRGLFGKSTMYLFGCGNAWKIEFNKENNFPSTLNLKHYGNEFVPVTVTGQGKTIKKE